MKNPDGADNLLKEKYHLSFSNFNWKASRKWKKSVFSAIGLFLLAQCPCQNGSDVTSMVTFPSSKMAPLVSQPPPIKQGKGCFEPEFFEEPGWHGK